MASLRSVAKNARERQETAINRCGSRENELYRSHEQVLTWSDPVHFVNYCFDSCINKFGQSIENLTASWHKTMTDISNSWTI